METNPQTKTCKVYGRELPLDNFRPNHKSPDGYLNTCKGCTAIARKEKAQEKKCAEGNTVEAAVERASNTISNALDIELVEELRARGWDVKCTRVISL